MVFEKTTHFIIIVFVICLAGCATGPSQRNHAVSVAVWDLENLSFDKGNQPDLGQMLSDEIIKTLQQHDGLQMVERQRLLLVLEELNLGSSELADENTRLKVGRMVGAQQMVFGGYQVVGESMRLDLRLVDVSSGKILTAAQKTTGAGDLAGWLRAAAEAAAEIVP